METKNKKSAWLWILLCLPMVFIVYFVVTLSGTDIDADKVKTVSVVDTQGKDYVFTEREDVDFYVDMYLNAAPLAAPLRETESEGYTVTFNKTDEDISFILYPEVNTNGCFIKKNNGEYASILSDYAKTLLQREESAAVYKEAGYSLPTLVFTSSTEKIQVLPKEYTWEYQDIAGNTVSYTDSDTATEAQRFNYDFKVIDNPIDFSVEPAECILSFTDSDGNVLQEKDFATLYRTSDTVLTARLEAHWSLSGKVQGGSAVYEFEVFYDVRPELINPPVEATAGRVVYFTFRHLSADEKVEISTQLISSPISLTFGENDDYACVALPLSVANAAGDYSLTFKIGEVSEEITLSVKGASDALNRARMDTELYIMSQTPDRIEAYKTLLAELHENGGEAMIDMGSKFSPPTDNEVIYDFGTYMSVNDVVPYFYLESIDYSVNEGDSIKASKRGVIIYMGEDEINGKMVVIDHGYGILSHYYNIGDFSDTKQVGDTVQEGEIIGSGGVSGMTYKEGEHAKPMLRFAVSVNGTFVDPNQFYESGFDTE